MSDEKGIVQFNDFNQLALRDLVMGLMKDSNKFPSYFDKNRKIKFLNRINEYLLLSQEFELCSDIQHIKGKIEDEYSNTNKTTKSK